MIKFIDKLKIEIPITGNGGNVPMIYNSACSSDEIKKIGPQVRSALPHYERKVDFLGSWASTNFANWGVKTKHPDIDKLFNSQAQCGYLDPAQKELENWMATFQVRNVCVEENRNLDNAQKEIDLWHHKLGISPRHIQQLMKVSQMKEPNGRVTTMDRVIVPKLPSAANCPIPICQTCKLSSAKQRKPKVTKSKAVESSVG